MTRRRLDAELVRRGLAHSRSQARLLIDDDLVTVGGAVAAKAGRLVAPGEAVEVLSTPRFVSRAGAKLDRALSTFGVDPTDRVCLDVGSSTGGFTDCLVQAGAALVVAVDVGRNQLHERLRVDDRVRSLERTDIRHLDVGALRSLVGGGLPDLAVVDVSFVSLRVVLPAVAERVDRPVDLVMLVKPQFEAGRVEAARGSGVIREPEVWERVLHEVVDASTALGMGIMGVVTSPIRGAKGNVEFLVHATDRAALVPPPSVELMIGEALAATAADASTQGPT